MFSDESDVEDTVSNIVSAKEEITLRKPSREEIDQITKNMIAQVHTRNMAKREGNDKVASMFIKGVNPKKGEAMKPKEIPDKKIKITNKKWEPKK